MIGKHCDTYRLVFAVRRVPAEVVLGRRLLVSVGISRTSGKKASSFVEGTAAMKSVIDVINK